MGLGELSPWHLLILAAVFLVIFGARKLPDSARSLGRAMRIFKAETQGLRGEQDRDGGATWQPSAATPVDQLNAPPAPAPPPPPPPPPAAAQPVSVRMPDGTVVSGVPLPEAERTSQPS